MSKYVSMSESKEEIISQLQKMDCASCGKSKCVVNYSPEDTSSWYTSIYLWNVHLRFKDRAWPMCCECLCNNNDICIDCCLSMSDSPLLLSVNSTPNKGSVYRQEGERSGGEVCTICQKMDIV
jgi:hypothetical protein